MSLPRLFDVPMVKRRRNSYSSRFNVPNVGMLSARLWKVDGRWHCSVVAVKRTAAQHRVLAETVFKLAESPERPCQWLERTVIRLRMPTGLRTGAGRRLGHVPHPTPFKTEYQGTWSDE